MRRGSCDLQFFLAVQLFFFTQRRVFKNAGLGGQCATMAAMNLPLRLQNIEILANGDLRSMEVFGQTSDQHTTLVFHHLDDQAATFFVKHKISVAIAIWRGRYLGLAASSESAFYT